MSRKIVKPTKSTKHEQQKNIIGFWRPTDQYAYFGQWYLSDFTLTEEICDELPEEIKRLPLYRDRYDVLEWLIGQERFNTAEKFMMMGKAALFHCKDSFVKMGASDDPSSQKKLGRLVTGFDNTVWDTYCRDIVKIGNYLKFSQNNDIKKLMLDTGDSILVEGSPLDKIWGVGMRFDDPMINDPKLWKGANYLGECLMFIRDIL